MLNILFIGDVVSQVGCEFLRKILPNLKREYNVDIVIANGENSAVGNGISENSANHMFDSGVDIITTGNHVYRRRDFYDYLDRTPQIVRPANFPDECNGKGYYVYDAGSYTLCVINMMGTVFMQPLDNPFFVIDKILDTVKADYYVIDFHAEATGEKKAFAYYVDGRVSCVVGTHTHVQTADEQILRNGTGYISDLGMTGPKESALGIEPQNVIQKLKYNMPVKFEVAQGVQIFNALLAKLSKNTGQCTEVVRINIEK